MINAKTTEVKQLLIHFSQLTSQQKGHFLDTLNHFMFASPQRRQQILREWKGSVPSVPGRSRSQPARLHSPS